MPAFLDPEHFTVRAGPETHKYGDPFRSLCSVQVQHDRYVYMYAIAGELDKRDALAMIDEVRRVGKEQGWKGIIWNRERVRPDGTKYTHTVRIPI